MRQSRRCSDIRCCVIAGNFLWSLVLNAVEHETRSYLVLGEFWVVKWNRAPIATPPGLCTCAPCLSRSGPLHGGAAAAGCGCDRGRGVRGALQRPPVAPHDAAGGRAAPRRRLGLCVGGV